MLLKESLAAALREEILKGALAAGEPIVESKWATRLGVAQASIREAINLLAAEGWVQKDSGRTARVTLLTTDDVCQIFQVRLPLESLAARLAASAGSDLNELDQIAHDMRAAVDCSNVRAFYERDLAFHVRICEMSGNRYLPQHLRRLLVPLFAFFVLRTPIAAGNSSGWHESVEQHLRLADAIRTRDPVLAEREVARGMADFLGGAQRASGAVG